MPFFCRKIINIITGLGILPLCIDDESFSINSTGYVLSQPPFSFVSIKKGLQCNGIKVTPFLYPFDLCLTPIHHPVEITLKNGNNYKTITLSP